MIIFSTCISPLDIAVDEDQRHIIIEGYITDQPGPHLITVKWSSKYTDRYAPEKEISGKVILKDDLGNTFTLKDSTRLVQTDETAGGCWPQTFYSHSVHVGFVTSHDFKADPRRSYTLQFRLEDKLFTSLPVRLPEKRIEIDTAFVKYELVPTSNEYKHKPMVKVYVGWKDPSGSNEFYRWKINGLFDYTVHEPAGIECAHCYVNDYYVSVKPIRDTNFDGLSYFQEIANLPYDGFRFQKRYLMEIEQFSIDREAFGFYNLVNTQLSIDGEIFDPAPARLSTNIYQIEGEPVSIAGHFSAQRVAKRVLRIEEVIPEADQKTILFRGSCRAYSTERYEHGYTEKPENWPWRH